MGIIQTLGSVSGAVELDYVGPEFDLSQFPEFRIGHTYFLSKNTNFFVNFFNMIRGVSIRYYGSWKKIVRSLDPSRYDLAVIDFSNHDYVVQFTKKLGKKTIVRVHNIEADMSRNAIKAIRFDVAFFKALLSYVSTCIRERKTMEIADHLIFLSNTDRDRAVELYGKYTDILRKSSVIPVCLHEAPDTFAPIEIEPPYILTTSALYGTHAEGIEWFIENVWKDLQKEEELRGYKYVVAGKDPERKMKQLCAEVDNCVLVDSPESVGPYLHGASLSIVPIFTGAGMKVKIAEALSYGLQVVTTRHSLVGYESASECVFPADTAEELKRVIVERLKMNTPEMHKRCVETFKRFYALDRSRREFSRIMNDMGPLGM